MLTEIDIKRIMEAKHRLTETLAEPIKHVIIKDEEASDTQDKETSFYERLGFI